MMEIYLDKDMNKAVLIVEKIKELQKKIKICNIITITALVLIVICIIIEFMVAQFMDDKAAAVNIVNNIAYVCYVLPVVAMAPLFFRVNFKNKLITELKKKEG